MGPRKLLKILTIEQGVPVAVTPATLKSAGLPDVVVQNGSACREARCHQDGVIERRAVDRVGDCHGPRCSGCGGHQGDLVDAEAERFVLEGL